MISATTAKLISRLPDKWVKYLSKKIVNQYLHKYANIHIHGNDNLKGITTPTIFVCNHLSNADALVLTQALKEIDPTFVAGIKLLNNAVTSLGANVVKRTHIIPNSTDTEGIKKTIQIIKDGGSLLIFPEGTRSRTGALLEGKKGILLIARLTGAPIVPIGLYGTEKLMPISQNEDMSGESFHHADVHITIGEQFEYPKRLKGQNKKDYEAHATQYIMNKISALLPHDYQGVYQIS